MRSWLLAWHRGFGLAAALWLALLAFTGSAIVFYDELDAWLNADWYYSHPVENSQVDRALAAARAGLPGFEPRFIDLPNEPGRSIILLGSVSSEPVQVFVAGDGQLLGSRENEQLRFDRRHVMDTLYALHVDLMLGGTGVWIIGLIALAWILDHLVAAVLSVPRLSKWREALAVHGKVGSLRRIFDLHRAPGLWLLPITLVIAVSGFCLSWHDEARAVVGGFSTLTHRLHEDFPDTRISSARLGVADALRVARQHGTGVADSVLILERNAAYGIRSFDERDIDPYGRLWTYISMNDGRILGQRHDLGESAGDAFLAWQYPLHSGKAFGLGGRLLIAGAGLGTIALCITGVILWWRRRRVLTGG